MYKGLLVKTYACFVCVPLVETPKYREDVNMLGLSSISWARGYVMRVADQLRSLKSKSQTLNLDPKV